MESLGLLTGRYELIEGELIDKMGQNPPHGYILTRVMVWLTGAFGKRVRCQSTIEVAPPDRPLSEPEPDIALLARDTDEYFERQPRGDELTLIIEVSDTSIRIDLTTKARLYARAGVPEYWVIDIPRRAVIVHRDPVEGAYSHVEQLSDRERISIEDASIAISELLR